MEYQTDYQLCYKLATLPSFNINTTSRKEEVRKRGVDCRIYSDQIDREELRKLKNSRSRKIWNTNI